MTANEEFQGYRGRGLPGSVHCRLNFEIDSQAFSNVKISGGAKKRREEVQKFKKRPQLGDKPSWDSCAREPWVQPQKMRQLSKYQSIKIPYNYRDLEISEVYKNQIFIPTSGKYEIDPYPFLDEKQKGRATRENIIVNRERAKEKETLRMKRTSKFKEKFNPSTEHFHEDMHKGYQEERLKTMKITKKKTDRILKKSKKKRLSLVDQYKRNRTFQRKKKLEKRRFDVLQNSIKGKKKKMENPRFITRV